MNPSDSPILSPSAICSHATSRTTECRHNEGSTAPGEATVVSAPKRKSLFPRSVFGQVSSIFTSSTNRPKSNHTRSDNNTTTPVTTTTTDGTTTTTSISGSPAQRTDAGFSSPKTNNNNNNPPHTDESFIEDFPDLHMSSLTLTSDSDSDSNNTSHRNTTTHAPTTSPCPAVSTTPAYHHNKPTHHTHRQSPKHTGPTTTTRTSCTPTQQNHSYGAGLGGLGAKGCGGGCEQHGSRTSGRRTSGRGTADYNNTGRTTAAAHNSALDAKGKLNANVENLKRIEHKTAQMANEAETFADLSKQLRQKYC
eukprot:GHVS01024241.1.p1 GENE.GHVS01024241.1~~GHVS01024241.1.p1  ORF type:complete len:307 (+),score=77.73 GHVS01024241.1:201-1121(+)